MTDLDVAVGVAKEAVRIAATIARRIQAQQSRLALEKSDKSPVTVADFAVQAIVARHLTAALGDVVLVGEESANDARADVQILGATVEAVRSVWRDATASSILAAIDRGSGEPADSYWTLDPIDGTKGFLRGEQYCVSLALIENHRPVVGALGCPNLPVPFYWAIDGRGAFEEGGARLRAREPGDEIVFCESVEESHSDQGANRRVIDALGAAKVRSVRMDSQCKYAVVARGDAHAYIRLPRSESYVEKIWDHAAGSLVALEAGCAVTDASGRPLDFSTGRRLENNRGVVVATPALHARLIAALS